LCLRNNINRPRRSTIGLNAFIKALTFVSQPSPWTKIFQRTESWSATCWILSAKSRWPFTASRSKLINWSFPNGSRSFSIGSSSSSSSSLRFSTAEIWAFWLVSSYGSSSLSFSSSSSSSSTSSCWGSSFYGSYYCRCFFSSSFCRLGGYGVELSFFSHGFWRGEKTQYHWVWLPARPKSLRSRCPAKPNLNILFLNNL